MLYFRLIFEGVCPTDRTFLGRIPTQTPSTQRLSVEGSPLDPPLPKEDPPTPPPSTKDYSVKGSPPDPHSTFFYPRTLISISIGSFSFSPNLVSFSGVWGVVNNKTTGPLSIYPTTLSTFCFFPFFL